LLLAFQSSQVGEITSGAFSPTLKKNVAMGYVKKGYRKAGTKVKVTHDPEQAL
jgi:aminomethyltransferase